jgi:hypothetical protein
MEWSKFAGTHPGKTNDGADYFFTQEIDGEVSFLPLKMKGQRVFTSHQVELTWTPVELK